MQWYVAVLKKYAVFEGRSRRKEYWMFQLWSLVFTFALMIVDAMAGMFDQESGFGVLSGIYLVAVLIPNLSVGCRRLHDINRSGWWQLIGLIPIIGTIIMIVWCATDGNAGDNRFGSDPKAGERLAAA